MLNSEKKKKDRSKDISWAKNERWTTRLLGYLDENPNFRHRYFSDWSKKAKKEERKKVVGKDSRRQMNSVLAVYVFQEDEDPTIRARFASEPAAFITSTNNQMHNLSTKYKGYVARLGQTGAGLKPEEIKPGEVRNLYESILAEFPPFAQLHEWWRTLPNYNPLHVSNSRSGKNPSQQVLDLLGLPGEDEANSEAEDMEGGSQFDARDADLTSEEHLDQMDGLVEQFGKMDSEPSSQVNDNELLAAPPPSGSTPRPDTPLVVSGSNNSLSSTPRPSARKDPISSLVDMKMQEHQLREKELEFKNRRLEVSRELSLARLQSKAHKRKLAFDATEASAKRRHESDRSEQESQVKLQLAQLEIQRLQAELELTRAQSTHPFLS